MNVEIHILQSFVPSCLNRDDTNTPKTATFGGVTRARISSQCFKRAIRLYMRDKLEQSTGIRTRRLAGANDALLARRPDLDPAEVTARCRKALKHLGFKLDSRIPNLTTVAVHLRPAESDRLADAIEADWDALAADNDAPDPGESKGRRGKRATSTPACPPHLAAVKAAWATTGQEVDLGLFGRMLAEMPDKEIDAACQVAHAISTHLVELEMDFFTAVDDLQPAHEPGAAMMGSQSLSSACFYRYALVQRPQLELNLGGDRTLANQAVLAFVRAAMEALPAAKQNSTGAQNLPSLVQLVVGADLPCSLANAFERPVRASAKASLVEASIQRLAAYQNALRTAYEALGSGQTRTLCVELPADVSFGTDLATSQRALLDWLQGALEES